MVKLEQAPAVGQAGPGEFPALVREHQSMVFSIAYHLLHDPGTAEELAQDVFLQLYRNLEKLESPAHVTAWLRKVTCHRAIDFLRRRRLRPETSLEDAPTPAVAAEQGDPFAAGRLRKLVAALPARQRAVVVLRYQEELELGEIAGTLGIPVGTVKSHLQRALAMLREKFDRSTEKRL